MQSIKVVVTIQRRVDTSIVLIYCVTQGINGYLEMVSPNILLDFIQWTTLLNTACILQNFLTTYK